MDRYPLTVRFLHWTVTLFVLSNLGLGWYLEGLDYYQPDFQDSLYYHRLMGVVILLFATSFILCSLLTTKPPLDEYLKPWEKRLARINLMTMKLLLLLVPLTGIALSTADGDGIPLVAGIEFPALMDFPEVTEDLIQECHHVSANLLAALVGLHILAVLKHLLIDRKNILGKML